jgi:hypothetical protein
MMRREVHIWRELRLRLIVRSIVRGTVDITEGDRGDVVCIWARLSVQLGGVDWDKSVSYSPEMNERRYSPGVGSPRKGF